MREKREIYQLSKGNAYIQDLVRHGYTFKNKVKEEA
jgi:hypothetical protein